MTEEQLEDARRQLDELAQKLGVHVSACGCCNGPTLRPSLAHGGDYVSIDYVVIGRYEQEPP